MLVTVFTTYKTSVSNSNELSPCTVYKIQFLHRQNTNIQDVRKLVDFCHHVALVCRKLSFWIKDCFIFYYVIIMLLSSITAKLVPVFGRD